MLRTYPTPCVRVARVACLRLLVWLLLAGLAVWSVNDLNPNHQPSLARAAMPELYVDGTNPTCSDANPGTEALPLCTIQSAADRATPGTQVYVKAGRYREQVTVRKSGSADALIAFANYGQDHVVIESPGEACFDLAGVEYIMIRGFELTGAWSTGAPTAGHAGAIKAYPLTSAGFGVRRSIFASNVIHHNNSGIWLTLSHHNQVVNNVIFASVEAPIRIKRGDYNTIANNLTFNNGSQEHWGITFYCALRTQVYHNTSVEPSGGAVYIYEGTSNLNGAQPGDEDYCIPSNDSVVRDNIGVVMDSHIGQSAPLVIGSSTTTDRDPRLDTLYGVLTNRFHHNLWYHAGRPGTVVSWGDLAERHTWPGYALLSLSEFQGKATGYGQASLAEDPLFLNPRGYDFRLSANSGARGAASDGTDMGANFAHLPHFDPYPVRSYLPLIANGLE